MNNYNNYQHRNNRQNQQSQQQQQQQGRKRSRFSDVVASSGESSLSASFDEQHHQYNNSNNNNSFINANDSSSNWNTTNNSSSSNDNNRNTNNTNNNSTSVTINLVDELRKCQREIAGLKAKDTEHAGQFNSLRAENEQLRLRLENVELKVRAEAKQMVEQLEAKVAKKSVEALHQMELKLVEFVNKWNEFHKQKGEEMMTTKLNGANETFEAKLEELHQKMGQERVEMSKQLQKLVDGHIEQLQLLPNAERLNGALATVDRLWLNQAQSQQIFLIEMPPNCHLTLGPSSVGASVSADGLTAIKGGVKGLQQHYTNFYANEPFSIVSYHQHQQQLSSTHQQRFVVNSRQLWYYEVTLKKRTSGCTFSIGLGDFGPEEADGSSVRRIGGLAPAAKIGLDQNGVFGVPACYYLAENNMQTDCWHIGQHFVEGDTLGCGLLTFPGGSLERHIFFTKNGQMFVEPLLVPSEVDKKLFPSVQLKGRGLIVAEANFGNNHSIADKQPFRWDVSKCEGL